MKIMKIYDRFEIPEDIISTVEEIWEEYPNDSYIDYDTTSDWETTPEMTNWLLENGTEKGERVLIRWWW